MIYLTEKKIAVIGIDHGYGNIKTANTITPTAITEYDTEPVFSGNILEYGGKYYRIGEGHKEFIVNKAMDEDFYKLTLMGVACELTPLWNRCCARAPPTSPGSTSTASPP